MPSANTVQAVIGEFLSKLKSEGRVTSEVVEDLKRLAEEDALHDQDAIQSALRKGPLLHDEAKES